MIDLPIILFEELTPGTLVELHDGDVVELTKVVLDAKRKDGTLAEPYFEGYDLDGPKNRRVRNKQRYVRLARMKKVLPQELAPPKNYWEVERKRVKK